MKGYTWTLEDQDTDFEKLQDPTLYHAKQIEMGSNSGVAFISEEATQGDPANHSAFVVGSNSGSTVGGTHISHGTLSLSARPSEPSLNVPKIDSHSIKLIEENMALLASFMTAFENFALGKLVEPLTLDEDLDQIDQDDLEELDLLLSMALVVRRSEKFLQRTGKSFIGSNKKTRMGIDMTKVKCYNYGIYSHYARECRKPKNREGSNGQGSSVRSNNNSPAPSNTTSTTSTTTSSDNLTPSSNNAIVTPPKYHMQKPPRGV
ncbi:putative transcription factor interactor and regulator CCHC(Zn) family [Helianthus annuus]|nr:putative transcription factor interactor and regulator CCHC(Zn) family [Helianthus annuus]